MSNRQLEVSVTMQQCKIIIAMQKSLEARSAMKSKTNTRILEGNAPQVNSNFSKATPPPEPP